LKVTDSSNFGAQIFYSTIDDYYSIPIRIYSANDALGTPWTADSMAACIVQELNNFISQMKAQSAGFGIGGGAYTIE
jgi:hypothetical protein